MDVRQALFRYRSYTPIPFLIVMVYFANPILVSFLGGGVLIVIGEFVRIWGVAIAGSETRTTGSVGGTYLITSGPFAYVRNPLYVGNMLIYTGVGVLSNALFPWLTIIALIFFFIQYTLIVTLEEEHLASVFGEDFKNYIAAVPRFIPRLTPYEGGKNIQPELNWLRGIQSEHRTLQAIGLAVAVVAVRWIAWS